MAPKQEDEKNHYYLVAVELELNEGEQVRYKKVDAVHRCKSPALIASSIGKIQVTAQKQFHAINSKTSVSIPNITDVVILGITHLGFYTEAEFFAGAQSETGPEQKQP